MVHSRFGRGGRNPPSPAPRSSIVEEQVGVGAKVAPEACEVASKASKPVAVCTARGGSERPYRPTQLVCASNCVTPTPMPQLPSQPRRVVLERSTVLLIGDQRRHAVDHLFDRSEPHAKVKPVETLRRGSPRGLPDNRFEPVGSISEHVKA